MNLERKSLPRHLYSFLRSSASKNGVNPGGWDKLCLVVPAFDPEKKSVELIRKAFKIGDERTLFEIIGKGKKKFYERFTGPQKKPQGIYISYERISSKYLKPVYLGEIN